MHVPVDPSTFVEIWVYAWEDKSGEDGGDDQEDGVVDEEGAKDVVDVERERGQTG